MARRTAVLGILALMLSASALSGCLGDDDPPKTQTAIDLEEQDIAEEDPLLTRWGDTPPSVFGYVTDTSRNPLPGASVLAQSVDEAFVAEADGYFEFFGLEPDKPHVLVASLEGYVTQSLRIVTHFDQIKQLDFMLEEEPVDEPYVVPVDRVMVIGCEAIVVVGHEHGKEGNEVHQECDGEDENTVKTLDFEVGPKVAGIVIEFKWTYATPLAEFMKATAETKGYGDLDMLLGEVVGPSVLRIEVAQESIAKYYTGNGGQFRLHVQAHPADDDEQALGAAFHFQQRIDVLVTAFYVEPNPTGYSGFATA